MSGAGASSSPPGLLPDTTLSDLQTAWQEREEEAHELMAKGFGSMALALRIYALEIRLKAIICQHLGLAYLPKACKTHDLSEPVIFTGRLKELEDPANIAIRKNWDLLMDFSRNHLNNQRYRPRSHLTAAELSRFMTALDDAKDGVLTWLSGRP